MNVTLFGITIEVMSQPKKADFWILVTVSGMMVFLHPNISELVSVSITALHPPRLSYLGLPRSTLMLSKSL